MAEYIYDDFFGKLSGLHFFFHCGNWIRFPPSCLNTTFQPLYSTASSFSSPKDFFSAKRKWFFLHADPEQRGEGDDAEREPVGTAEDHQPGENVGRIQGRNLGMGLRDKQSVE